MNPLEMMMRDMGKSSCDEKVFISGSVREAIRANFNHIEDLKEGDKVQWKRGMKDRSIPRYDQVIEVFRILDVKSMPKARAGSNHACDETDFSSIMRNCDGEINEYAFDSRRFERVS